MYDESTFLTPRTFEVLLDGAPVQLPETRRSLPAIRTYLETIALENERVLCQFKVNGRSANAANISQSETDQEKSSPTLIEAQTVGLAEMPLRMLETALNETRAARAVTEAAVTQVLINDAPMARELWWELARKMKEPLLTLSLLPESIYQSPAGAASLMQVRKWQLQQLAVIMKEVDEAAWQSETSALSNALENRALPWLDKLHDMILLWRETVLAGLRAKAN